MPNSSKLYLLLLSLLATIVACGAPPAVSAPRDRGLPVAVNPTNSNEFYRQMGLLAVPPPISFVGKTAFYASRSSDTTLVLASISLPNRALTFSREGDRYSAPYEVHIRVTRGGTEAAALNALEIVRVGTFKEVNRSDESVIFQHFFRLPPGEYSLSLIVRDVGGARGATQDAQLTVPRISATGFSTPLLAYEFTPRSALDSTPRLLASPRSTAVFGRDSLISVFLEAYGASGTSSRIRYSVTNDAQERVFSDSAILPRTGALFSGTVQIPISSVGLGITKLSFSRSGATDTASIRIFVSFGEDVPIMSFANMIEYLRFFAPEWRLKTLRNATPAQRASLWAAFLRDTDPVPETSTNEALEGYFARIRQANDQFLNDRNPGWLSDRGMVFVALGEPTTITDRTVNQTSGTEVGGSTRVQIWTYQQYRTQLVFYEDVGRWRLTRSSESEFWAVNSRRLSR